MLSRRSMMFCRSAGLSSKRLHFTIQRSFSDATTSVFNRPAVRYTIGLTSIAVAWTGALGFQYYQNNLAFRQMVGASLVATAVVVTGGGVAFAKFGFGAMSHTMTRAAVKPMGIADFWQSENVRKLAHDAMKHGNESMNKYPQLPKLKSRHREVVRVSQFVLNQANRPNSCMLVGPQTIGKSVLSRTMVELLREGEILPKTPAIYLRVGDDPEDFINGALEAFGIDKEVAVNFHSNATYGDISRLIQRVCYEFDEANVVVFDDIKKSTPEWLLKNLNDISRKLSENHPSTVVVLVASDATDSFIFKKEPRRKTLTLAPFDSKQLLEYLKVDAELNDKDANKLTDIINKEFIPHMGDVGELVAFAENEDTRTIDFEKVSEFIETKKQKLIGNIARYCGNEENAQKLKELVEEKQGDAFHSYELVYAFGDLKDPGTVGYELLRNNLLFYQGESDILMFHAPVVRNAISELPTTA